LRAVVAVVATGGAVVTAVVEPGASEVGVVSVGRTVDVVGDALAVASDVVAVVVLGVGVFGLFELHPPEASAAASRAADAMRLTTTTSIQLAAYRVPASHAAPDVAGGITTAARAKLGVRPGRRHRATPDS
jgi:hypothetical protein